jgi:aspartate/tyrosine/aromatic aminotransferase
MFEHLDLAKPDAILGLSEAFRKDPNPAKINLTVGVYKDAEGATPVLVSVKQAEARILKTEQSKGYLPMTGSADFAEAVQGMLFGENHELLGSKRMVTAQTPGGTGALRVAGDFLHTMYPDTKLWLSQPTWPNHPGVFKAAGMPIETYPYFDATTNSLALDAMLERFDTIPAGDVVLLHGCCHNPTGVDLSHEQWERIAEVVRRRQLLPLIDFAYQGFGEGIEEDASGLRAVCRACDEVLICSSYSKNFSLYNERTGALTLIAQSDKQAEAALSHIKLRIRTNYSNPPAHGGAIVSTVLGDDGLRTAWHQEVAAMRDRIRSMRELFVRTLVAQGVERDFSFMGEQRGMFSFSGLTPSQVDVLREKYAIYVVGSGRVNVAGMTPANMDRLCEAIASVLD